MWLNLALLFNSLWCVTFAQDTKTSMVLQVFWIFAYLGCLAVLNVFP